ncbi:hypothetical protein L2E82_05435 [Cichorium intybus]|uniref:Uncharacterized protein n=1 Tax=Cichorium intybus TaxID=13427 RepID=A0ACB9H8L0_CICIN|nr:hypothetical protein L2E82_05435 [Cichorium intybus]
MTIVASTKIHLQSILILETELSDTMKQWIVGSQLEKIFTNDKQIQSPIQLYQVEHQSRVRGRVVVGKKDRR